MAKRLVPQMDELTVNGVAAQEDGRLRVDLEVGAGGVRGAHAAVVEAGAVRLALDQIVRIEGPLRRALLEGDLQSE